ncbi:MAG TPA: DUF1552 domain-containing protein [Polyangiaceae bacterium]|nr:DUF1552 domain-containing protein [Polyangiaceae bacterium]
MSARSKVRPVRSPVALSLPRIGRRALLGAGAGAALLPFLPVLNSRAQDAGPPKRILFVFQDNGTIASEWKPTGTETNFTFKRILAPLEAHKQDLLLLSGLDLEPEPGPPHSGHPQLFTNVPGDLDKFRECPSVSLDQFIAQQRKDPTRFPTLELGVVPFGGDDFYTHEILYRAPYEAVPVEPSPYAAFARIFNGAEPDLPGNALVRARHQSIFNGVKSDLTRLRGELGTEDQAMLDRHADAIAELERRLVQGPMTESCVGPTLAAPVDFQSVANYRELAEAQMDVMVAALACDATRVGTLVWSTPASTQTFPWLGDFGNNHHLLSHDASKVEALIQIDTWYSEQHAKLIAKLKAVPEAGGGTLFDNTVVFFANPLGDGNAHRKVDLPLMLAGGKWAFSTGRYLDFKGTPHGHLLVSLAHAMGVEVQSFGAADTGTGPLTGLGV